MRARVSPGIPLIQRLVVAETLMSDTHGIQSGKLIPSSVKL